MILAAKTNFSQVLPTLITLTPSGLDLKTYGSWWTCIKIETKNVSKELSQIKQMISK